jgi:YHS domain-containing protein
MAKDPVCGMMVDEKSAKFKSDYQGKTYYFCASSCKDTFDKNPAKFVKGTSGGHGGGCCCCGGH